ELLTGHRPYPTTNQPAHEIARLICEHEPTVPSAIVLKTTSADVPHSAGSSSVAPLSISSTRDGKPDTLRRRPAGDMDAILLTALQKDPRRRYSSVERFGEDIRRQLIGEPIVARPNTLGYRTKKFIRRHQVGVAACLLVAASLIGGMLA